MAKAKKAGQFVAQAEKRVQRAIKAVENVGKLARMTDRTDAQVKQILSALQAATKRVETAFAAKAQAEEMFRLA